MSGNGLPTKPLSPLARIAWNGLKWFAGEMLVSVALFFAACVLATAILLIWMVLTGASFGD